MLIGKFSGAGRDKEKENFVVLGVSRTGPIIRFDVVRFSTETTTFSAFGNFIILPNKFSFFTVLYPNYQ